MACYLLWKPSDLVRPVLLNPSVVKRLIFICNPLKNNAFRRYSKINYKVNKIIKPDIKTSPSCLLLHSTDINYSVKLLIQVSKCLLSISLLVSSWTSYKHSSINTGPWTTSGVSLVYIYLLMKTRGRAEEAEQYNDVVLKAQDRRSGTLYSMLALLLTETL